MNDLYFMAKKACKDENHPGKPCIFNEILLCRMKSEQARMKSSVSPQMKLNPPYLNLAKQDFIHVSGFIPTQADLVEKDSELYPILSLFLVVGAGYCYAGIICGIRTAEVISVPSTPHYARYRENFVPHRGFAAAVCGQQKISLRAGYSAKQKIFCLAAYKRA